MLDTGVVVRELFLVQPQHLTNRFAEEFGVAFPRIADLLAFIGALHDIGKISPGFQSKREDLCAGLRAEGFRFTRADETNHGQVILEVLPDLLTDCLECNYGHAVALSRILAAHHGAFLGGEAGHCGAGKWDEARRAVIRFLAGQFWDESLSSHTTPTTPALVLLTGLISVSDWLASAEEFFPYARLPLDIEAYLEERTERAWEVLKRLRFKIAQTVVKGFRDLFGFDTPNPCQAATLQVVEQLEHPMLIVIESPMGSGKTEAAQAAFASVMARSELRGIYYALPTQATGNAMLPRMESFLDNLGLERGSELHLLHSNADLNRDYERLRVTAIDAARNDTVASSWFTARKRGLLAGYGVGTIDQAILAALKVRHFFVRLFGLSGKFLVLDEVHAYDAYMVEEIDRLVGWLAKCQTSVILLSATLPAAKREKLLQAFNVNASCPKEAKYPSVIGMDSTGRTIIQPIVGLEPESIQMVPLVMAPQDKAQLITSLLSEKLAYGGCAACIMNTVGEAQELYKVVRQSITDVDLILFHSRFTLERKLEIEKALLCRYGKEGKRPSRGIVIATQVIEQSLDVDFDMMVTDIAPVDLLLQRAGRLQRHKRERPHSLGKRMLYVCMPDLLKMIPDFGGTGYVYARDILLRTCLLFAAEGDVQTVTISVPYGVSALIESVYGDGYRLQIPPHLSDSIELWKMERLGTQSAQTFFAAGDALMKADECLNDPDYLGSIANDFDDEGVVVTRLTRPNVTLIIIDQGQSILVNNSEAERRLYAQSVRTDNRRVVEHFQGECTPKEWNESPLLRRCHPLPNPDGTAINGLCLAYDKEFGLRIARRKRR